MVPNTSTPIGSKTCTRCGLTKPKSEFLPTRNPFIANGYSCICNDCTRSWLRAQENEWNAFDKFCQFMDIPFEPERYEKLKQTNGINTFMVYNALYQQKDYANVDWATTQAEYKDLAAQNQLRVAVPALKEERLHELREKWGGHYDVEALSYLETLYEGIVQTQNIGSALNGDQALKICKISYEIDVRIQEGKEFDKLLASYDKLVKAAEFNSKNAKNASDFDSIGELCIWLEKRGFKNSYYNDVTKDVVDETIKNVQNWTQRLYINESGISEEITKRIESLQNINNMESNFDIPNPSARELDDYDNEGFEMEIEEDFRADEDGDES